MRRRAKIRVGTLFTSALTLLSHVPLHEAFSSGAGSIARVSPHRLHHEPPLSNPSYAFVATKRLVSRSVGHEMNSDDDRRRPGASASRTDDQGRDWLQRATQDLMTRTPGTLLKGKWHELISMMRAWSKRVKSDPMAPLILERLLKRIIQERLSGNAEATSTTALYNTVIDAWASSVESHGKAAARRARDILNVLQQTYQAEGEEDRMPDSHSFGAVLKATAKVEGALTARDYLFWMGGLYHNGLNSKARPTLRNYVTVLHAFAESGSEDAGIQAERVLHHMNRTGVTPTTLCYNIAINAHVRSKRGRTTAEHAERILEEMQAEPDEYTYGSVVNAWATSGMNAQAAERAEDILRKIEDDGAVQANVVVYNACLNAWCKSNSPAAVNRTESLLERMEQSDHLSPDLISYNTYIHALSMNGKQCGLAQRADDILSRWEERFDVGEVDFGPNSFSYNLVIEGYARSRERSAADRACKVLRRLVQRDGVEPDTISFNQVISALARSGTPGSAQRAEELLHYMDHAHQASATSIRPDVVSYSSVITAWARSGESGSAERAERLLNDMEVRYLAGDTNCRPNIVAYNAAVDAWARSGEGTLGARRAESLLRRMETKVEAGDKRLSPSIVTFNSLLNAWAKSGTRCCAYKAESYLDRMWELYESGNKRVKPDDRSYNTVINAISKSKSEDKAQKALRILRRLDKLYQAGIVDARPTTMSYTAVLNSCAFPACIDAKSRRKALDTAIFTLEELQGSEYGTPNHVTYGVFFKVCANLLPVDDELRRVVVEPVFQQACEDGQVGDMVLAHLRHAAPADLYKELLADVKPSRGRRITLNDLPINWRCNVQEQRRFGAAKSRLPARNKKYSKRQPSRRLRG